MGGRGKADMANEVRPCGVPRRSFGYFPIAGKVPRPAGRNPVKLPAARRVVAPYEKEETTLTVAGGETPQKTIQVVLL